jgi:hypothetical protein
LRRREAWRSSILKGRAFLERGTRNNPDDWSLFASLGFLLSDANKFQAFRDPDEAFAAAADAYGASVATGKSLGYVRRSQFYALARVSGKQFEALEMARTLYAEGPQNRTPTLRMLLIVLEAHENPSMDFAARAIGMFGTAEQAYEALSRHWQRSRDRFPVHGVAAGLRDLEQQLSIPAEQSIFNQAPPAPPGPDEWFRE